MKIIGHTNNGYICEVTKEEMKLSTGKDEPWCVSDHAHPVGNIVNVPEISKHLRNMEYTATERAKAAETLRSCANIIETIPAAFTAPPPPPVPVPEPAINPVS